VSAVGSIVVVGGVVVGGVVVGGVVISVVGNGAVVGVAAGGGVGVGVAAGAQDVASRTTEVRQMQTTMHLLRDSVIISIDSSHNLNWGADGCSITHPLPLVDPLCQASRKASFIETPVRTSS